MLFNVLAIVAEFEGDLIRLLNRKGIMVAKAKAAYAAHSDRPAQQAHLVALHHPGEHGTAERGELRRRAVDPFTS